MSGKITIDRERGQTIIHRLSLLARSSELCESDKELIRECRDWLTEASGHSSRMAEPSPKEDSNEDVWIVVAQGGRSRMATCGGHRSRQEASD